MAIHPKIYLKYFTKSQNNLIMSARVKLVVCELCTEEHLTATGVAEIVQFELSSLPKSQLNFLGPHYLHHIQQEV